jgi:hypothetical protein
MARFLDLGSEIQDPRSGIEKNPDPGPRINIRKYSGSATLLSRVVGLKSPASVQ